MPGTPLASSIRAQSKNFKHEVTIKMVQVMWSHSLLAARRSARQAMLVAAGASLSVAASAQGLQLFDARVKDRANGVLSVMAYSVVPDLTSSNLQVSNATSDNPSINMTQLGGGATFSKSFPLYLEGALAYARYDPTFIATNGAETRSIPTRWNSLTATGGVGWDFPITSELAFRPIVDIALGKVASDLAVGKFIVERVTDKQINFLNGGSLNAYGVGGAVMLDWEHYRLNYEVDVELRYSDIELRTFGNSADAVQGKASARTANIWARYRAPTGLYSMDRPIRYVLEFSHSRYMGSQADVLGFDYLTTLGTGLELDTSAHKIYATRLRAVLRYVFGNDVHGVSLGLAASF